MSRPAVLWMISEPSASGSARQAKHVAIVTCGFHVRRGRSTSGHQFACCRRPEYRSAHAVRATVQILADAARVRMDVFQR